jgi:hypothetical protein
MIARQLIYVASFVRPEAFKAILEAFDAVWAEIAGNFGNDTLTIAKLGGLRTRTSSQAGQLPDDCGQRVKSG